MQKISYDLFMQQDGWETPKNVPLTLKKEAAVKGL